MHDAIHGGTALRRGEGAAALKRVEGSATSSTLLRGVALDRGWEGFASGMNFIEIEFTQWRVLRGVKPSPRKT
jgi:hypothetical protein